MLTFHTMLLALFFVCAQLLEAYEIVSLPNLSLNREAFSLSSELLAPFHNASFGFSWNDEDASTLKWRPQGITATVVEEREFVLVSWYGRSEEDYANRGVRISCVDITSASNILYRHVLLILGQNLERKRASLALRYLDILGTGRKGRQNKMYVPR